MQACSSKLKHWPTRPCASDIAGSSRFCEAEHMKAFLDTCGRGPALRLRRRAGRRHRRRRRHAAGEGRLGRGRCRDHQPVGSRRKARPRAAQAGRGAWAAGPRYGGTLPQGTSACDGRLLPQRQLAAGLRRLRKLVQIVDVEHRRLVEARDLLRVLAVDQIPFVRRMRCATGANAEADSRLLQRRAGEDDARPVTRPSSGSANTRCPPASAC